MARRPREKSKTQVYHVMLRGNERRQIFLDDEDRLKLLETIARNKYDKKFELYAYCLMDNHVHLLINEKDYPLSEIMKSICISYAMHFNKKYGRIGYLFQSRFCSETVEDQPYLLNVIRYIHNNPVKAAMVEHASDYKWCSYTEFFNYKDTDSAKLIDIDFILNIFSNEPAKALSLFIEHNGVDVDYQCMDISETPVTAKKANTMSEAHLIITRFLAARNLTYEDIKNQQRRIKGTVKHELIVLLKEETNLSCREIAKLLDMNKSTVHALI